MAKEFKIKYATRVKLQRAIQQQILGKGLVQERTMYKSIRISSATGDLNTLYITINAVYYYVFLDRGTQDIDPQFVTYDAINSPLGQEFLKDCVDAYVNWMMDNYPILSVGNIMVDKLKVKYRYNVFGGEEYGYSGFYPSSGYFEDSSSF